MSAARLAQTRVPGLVLLPEAVGPAARAALVRDIAALRAEIAQASANSAVAGALPPQPVQSRDHNLAHLGERYFHRLRLRDPADGRLLGCEHFPSYGSPGHSLSYFQRNHAIPGFVNQRLLPLLAALPEISAATAGTGKAAAELEWRMTLNTYDLHQQRQHSRAQQGADGGAALFPWHVDIAQNGLVTAILTLESPGAVQFAAPDDLLAERDGVADTGDTLPTEDDPVTIELVPGSLLIAAGDARWRFLHRVVDQSELNDDARRTSLVFGCS